ncbi:ribosomal subunit interface protein [Clostridia bacterium]|nr:ribosomal subunit interface protein [Clostridia bacterium]
MNVTITAKKMQAGDVFTEYANEKVSAKLGKFFSHSEGDARIVLQPLHNDIILELTVKHGGLYFRAEQTASDKNEALDSCLDRIVRQIRKHKTKISKHLRDSRFDSALNESEFTADESGEDTGEFNVVRSKKFALRSMNVQEAILQMNLVGHKFFMFLNGDTGKVNVVYIREAKGSEYGLLEPEED